MLTPLATKEDDSKSSTEYYYTQHPQHYYCPRPFNDDSNNLHHYRPSIYETNQYYSLTPTYSHQQINNEEDSNNEVPSTVYVQTYPHQQHYSTVGNATEMLYSQNLSDQPITSLGYDYTLSPVPPVSSNSMFHQHSNYVQPSVDQTDYSASNNGSYLTPYVS